MISVLAAFLATGAIHAGDAVIPSKLDALTTAIQTGDAAFVDQHVQRFVMQRIFKEANEEATVEQKNDRLIRLLKGCKIASASAVDLGLDEGEDAHQVLWDCPARGEIPAVTAKTIFVRRGEKFEVVVSAFPASMPTLETPAVKQNSRP
jgi:hypothetical protein